MQYRLSCNQKQRFILTIFQAKEQLLLLQQLLYGVQADADGVHIKQRLQDVGAQPSTTTHGLCIVEHSKKSVFASRYMHQTETDIPNTYMFIVSAKYDYH